MNEDFSSIFENLNINKDSISPEMVDNIMNIINNTSSADSNSPGSFSNIDIDTILKMKTILDKVNQKNDEPRSRLLNSLRPYLKKNKQSKLDQCIQLMNMSKIIEILPFIGGDNNGHK